MTDAIVKSNGRHLRRLHPLAHPHHALDQCGRDDRHDHERLGDLQRRGDLRLAAFSRAGSRSASGPEGALQWHFLAMWILVVNGIAYIAYGLSTGRFRRMLLPIRIAEIIAEIRAALGAQARP